MLSKERHQTATGPVSVPHKHEPLPTGKECLAQIDCMLASDPIGISIGDGHMLEFQVPQVRRHQNFFRHRQFRTAFDKA